MRGSVRRLPRARKALLMSVWKMTARIRSDDENRLRNSQLVEENPEKREK
jgi:hypothetical protein